MATECDVNKSRRFDLGMSRRTRRSTSTIACYQDQHVQQQLRQDAKLKALFQCQDTEEQPPYPYEDQELGILQAPLQCEGDEQKIQNQYYDEQEEKLHHHLDEEQEKKLHHYLDEEQEKKLHHHLDEEQEKKLHHYLDEEQEKKPHQHQDGEMKTSKQYLDEDQKTLQQCQDEENVPNQYEEEEKAPDQYEDENTPWQYQDEEQKSAKQCKEQEEEQKTSEKNQDEKHKTLKVQQQCQDKEQKTLGQCITVKKLITPPCADDVPRFSLRDLIQEKQLLIGEAKATGKLGIGEKAIADHKIPAPLAAGGATLAMVIKRPEKKSMGMIRRCVKALNQMVKAKHGSKKNKPF